MLIMYYSTPFSAGICNSVWHVLSAVLWLLFSDLCVDADGNVFMLSGQIHLATSDLVSYLTCRSIVKCLQYRHAVALVDTTFAVDRKDMPAFLLIFLPAGRERNVDRASIYTEPLRSR